MGGDHDMTILLFRRRFERHFRLSGIFFCVVWEESYPIVGLYKIQLVLEFCTIHYAKAV